VVARACKHLVSLDPAFSQIVDQVGPVRFLPPRNDHFAYLVRSIVYQQLAGAAAKTIHGRLHDAVGGEVTPVALLKLAEDQYRAAGISRNKFLAIFDLASRLANGELLLDTKTLSRLSDLEVVEHLSEVRGIGPWTAQMFLMNQLRRIDVWPTGDLGVRKGFGIIHNTAMPTPKELEILGENLRPYRSVAAVYCWRIVDQQDRMTT
jgi:DNA-3-methyladenine glycosylase II